MSENKENSLFRIFLFRYLPYWPLFLLLLILGCIGGYIYLRYAEPVYEISANILIKDEKKGADETKALEALNIYTTKKIVENEIEVLHSHELMSDVVKNLHLYAPVFEFGRIRALSAYSSSPIEIEVQNPDHITEEQKVNLNYLKGDNKVIAGTKSYAIGQWVKTPWGMLKFSLNKRQKKHSDKPLFFQLIPPKNVVDNLLSGLEVAAVNKLSSVIVMKIKDAVPERGVDVLNELIKVYNDAEINDKNGLAANTLAFIEDRMKHVVKELDSIERNIQKIKSEKGIVDLSSQGKLFLDNVSDNDRKVTDLNMRLSILNQIENYVLSKDKKVGIMPSTVGLDDPTLSQLLQKLFEDEMQYERLKKTTPAGNPMMFSLKNEIDQIRPTIIENIQNQRSSLQASKNDLYASNNMYASILKSIPQKERELLEISRQQSIKNDAYAFLLHKREETALTYAATVSDSRIIDKAVASLDPTNPKKLIVFPVSIAIALFLGIAIVSGKELLNNKILFRSDIESLSKIPVVAEIVKVKAKSPLVVNNLKYAYVADQFRQLRAAVGLFGSHINRKSLLITSSITGEGKSFISNNLALSLALSGKKVVLLDMDLRNPRTSEVFGLQNQNGIAEVLEDRCELADVVYSSEYNNLFIVPSGTTKLNTAEILLNGNLEDVFNRLENKFDYLIVDTAPVDPVMDAYVISRYCDTTLFIVKHNFTPKAIIEMLDKNNEIKALKKVAIVFNAVKPRGFFIKGFGYGYGYGYKKVYSDNLMK